MIIPEIIWNWKEKFKLTETFLNFESLHPQRTYKINPLKKYENYIYSFKHGLCMLLSLANPEKGKKKGGPSGDRPSREEIIKKFDKDGDGKLSDEEKAEARKTMMSKRKMPPFVIKKFDKDGDGELNDEEKAAARAEMAARKKEVMAKFDKDGDGKLNEEERKAAMAARPKPGEGKEKERSRKVRGRKRKRRRKNLKVFP